jgi:hypothetical protein
MKRNLAAGLLKAACVLMLVCLPVVSVVSGQEYHVDSMELTVYRDGLVQVAQAVTVNETYPAITVSLLTSAVENVLVVDENSTVLDYEIRGSNMTVYSLGARRVVIEYDTVTLTRKEAGVWTLAFSTPYNLTVLLPRESTVMYLNQVPTAISTLDNRTVLQLSPGQWEISYVPPIVPPPPPPSPPPPPPSPPIHIPLEYLVPIILFAVGGGFFLLRRRGSPSAERIFKEHPELRKEDREVIRFIAEGGGRVLEAEIREEFPELPRTTVWRLLKRLEKMEIVTVKKVGLQNQIELKK